MAEIVPTSGVRSFTLRGSRSGPIGGATWTRWGISLPGTFDISTHQANYPTTAVSGFELVSVGTPQLERVVGSRYEYALQVQVSHPDWWVGQRAPNYAQGDFGQPIKIKMPGEMFNVDLVWGPTGSSVFFHGGVYPLGQPGIKPPGQVQAVFGEYWKDYIAHFQESAINGSGSGLDLSIQAELEGETLDGGQGVAPLYRVGWGVRVSAYNHLQGTPQVGGSSSEWLPDGDYWDYVSFTDNLETVLRMDPQHTNVDVRRVYIDSLGRTIVEGLNGDRNEVTRRNFGAAFPEQSTALCPNGPTLEVGSNQGPVVTGDETEFPQRIAITNIVPPSTGEDVSAPTDNSPFYASMLGSGLVLFADEQRHPNALWYQSGTDFGFSAYTSFRKASHQWLSPEPEEVPVRRFLLPATEPVNSAIRLHPQFLGAFLGMTFFEYVGETGGAVQLKFARFLASYTAHGGGIDTVSSGTPVQSVQQVPEVAAIATLDALPFCPMRVIAEGSTWYATDGASGCWSSVDSGASWAVVPGWSPAFVSPVLPAYCTRFSRAWGALGLRLGNPGESPVLLFRRSYDRGQTWEDEVEVGEVAGAVWGCALANVGKRQARLVIANGPALRWYSDNDGETWEEIDA